MTVLKPMSIIYQKMGFVEVEGEAQVVIQCTVESSS
jgi:hypothetical protein